MAFFLNKNRQHSEKMVEWLHGRMAKRISHPPLHGQGCCILKKLKIEKINIQYPMPNFEFSSKKQGNFSAFPGFLLEIGHSSMDIGYSKNYLIQDATALPLHGDKLNDLTIQPFLR